MLFIHETFLVYKLETFKEVKHIMIMIIAIIYIFFILCDIWSTVENYFQKILRPPEKVHSPPLKIQKVQVPPFCQRWKFFKPPCREGRGEDTWIISISIHVHDCVRPLTTVCYLLSQNEPDQLTAKALKG